MHTSALKTYVVELTAPATHRRKSCDSINGILCKDFFDMELRWCLQSTDQGDSRQLLQT